MRRRSLGRALPWALSCFALSLGLGCPQDGDTPPVDSIAEEKNDVPPEVAMADKLRLEERAFPLLIWAAYIASEDYFDKGRLAPRAQLRAALEGLGKHTPEFFGELEGDELRVTVRAQTQSFSIAEVDDVSKAADVLEQVLTFAKESLDLEDEPLHELEYAAINGFFAPLDPHTVLLTPEQHADLGVKTRGHFGGIGAEIRAEDRRIVIVRVLPGSPAEKFGLKNGDVIIQIGDQSTVNMGSTDAQELIRGPVGTVVKFKVKRDGKALSLEVTRDTIKVESVKSTMLPESVGYISVSTFQKDTAQKLQEAVEGMTKNAELAGLVIDLRGNSGGLLTQASGILDQMVTGKNTELVIVHSAKGRESEKATDELVFPDKTSVVVLIDEGSASASEIVAGSVKHLGRGVVIGRGSFGKGTVQMLKAAEPYGRELAFKVTVAEYRVAGDRKIQGVGVLPDLELLPVQLSELEGVGRYYDEERFERQRERAKTAHLPSAQYDAGAEAFVGKPAPVLRYLDQPGVSAGAETEQATEMGDPEIRLAQEIARKLSGKTSRKEMLATLAPLSDELGGREDTRIAEALGEKKVDWSTGGTGEAKLEVTTRIEGPSPIPAGEPFTLHIEVRNAGDAPVHRLHAVTECNHDELDGIELLLGKLDAGETLTRDIQLHVMPWHTDFSDRLGVQIHAGEPDAEPDGEASVGFDIVGAERPRFSFDYWIVDDPAAVAAAPKRPPVKPVPGETPFEVKGNGDGMLQAGEHVLLAFEVHNAGPGKSTDTRAFLRNLSGAQGLLEEGLFVVGPLAPGKSATGAFGITIGPNADPSQPFELDLGIGDAHIRESARHKMRLRILPERPAFVGKKERMQVKADTVRLYNGADASAAIFSELGKGARVDVVGRAGEWVASRGANGRRMWIPGDLLEEGAGSKATPADIGQVVDPPRIELAELPLRVKGETVKISGRATHARRVRDVVVRVKPTEPGGRDHKVAYKANPEAQGEAARTMDFEAQVPLDKGSNRITVIVRDGAKVERRRDVLVYRE